MLPLTALMLAEALEEDRRRDLRHPRRWMSFERPARSTTRAGGFRLARVFRLADSKA
jgi:hypothetical protein